MKADPMGAVYTFEFLQTLEEGHRQGHYRHGWRQRRRNVKLVERISELACDEQWHEILQQAPEALYHNARHERLLLELAFAAQALGATETQWTYLEFAWKYFPGSANVHVQIIHAFYRSGSFDDANNHVAELVKTADPRLLQKILSALPEVITEQFPGHEVLDQVEALRNSLKEDGEQPEKWEQLCALLESLNLYGQAMAACQLAMQATGNQSDWNQYLLGLRLQQAEARLAFHQQLGSPDSLLDDLQHAAWRIRTEYYQKQSVRQPQQPLPSIQLGWCLLGTGNWYEAIKWFEQLQQNQELSLEHQSILLLGLGEAQQAVRRFDHALETFSQLLARLSELVENANLLRDDTDHAKQRNTDTIQKLDQQLGQEIPGFDEQSFCQRSLKRIKTLAEAMNHDLICEKCDQLAEKIGISTDN